MVHSCCVIGCAARWTAEGQGFFRLPSENDPERRRQWLYNINRGNLENPQKPWIPKSADRVCKAHFLTGNTSYYS